MLTPQPTPVAKLRFSPHLLCALCASAVNLAACNKANPPPALTNLTTPEGLIIRDTRLGTGTPCPPGAAVTINFSASLPDGRVYDSTELRHRPLTLSLADPGLIRGLREGIPGMRPGGTRTLHIPWQLAYGEQGRDPIPPKADLYFDIELLSFQPEVR